MRISALVFLRVISLSLLFPEVAFCLCNRGIICLILCYFKQALLPVNNEIYLIPEKSLPTYHDLNRSSKAVIVEFRYFYFPIILCYQVKKNDINKNFDPSTQTKNFGEIQQLKYTCKNIIFFTKIKLTEMIKTLLIVLNYAIQIFF